MSLTDAPIFIVAHGRSGSTLLRYLLDSHPDVASPAEVELGPLCEALTHTLSLTQRSNHPIEGKQRTCEAVRHAVDAIMTPYAHTRAKSRWCDKSIRNANHLDLLSEVFPDAQFICLHRYCLDVVHSTIEACKFGYPGRLAEYVAHRADNIVEALVESWCDRTSTLLEFECAHSSRCTRVLYEHLTIEPERVMRRVFEFLRLSFDPDLLRSAFVTSHDLGPGDWKIRSTTRIHSGSVGTGAANLPLAFISKTRLKMMKGLLTDLGYDDRGRPAAAATLCDGSRV